MTGKDNGPTQEKDRILEASQDPSTHTIEMSLNQTDLNAWCTWEGPTHVITCEHTILCAQL